MATANELFQDAMVRRQIYLQHYSQALTSEIVDLLDATEADLRAQLERRLATIVEHGADFGPVTTQRLKVLADALESIRATAFDQALDAWNEQLHGLAEAEADFVNDHFNDASPVKIDLILPDAAKLAAIVDAQPFQGKTMSDWAGRVQAEDIDRMMNGIRIGLAQGETVDAISRRVLGTGTYQGADGLTEVTRRNAEAITRTAINHVSNAARGAVFAANEDVFDMEQIVATLDSRTTEICAALDGQTFKVGKGPIPPLHWGCRTIRVAVIDPAGLIGQRPENSELSDDDIRGDVGQVPATTTYQSFLERQSEDFQAHVLGDTKAQLFRDGGLTLDKFVVTKPGRNFGNVWTLDELRKREPQAFRRAKLDK